MKNDIIYTYFLFLQILDFNSSICDDNLEIKYTNSDPRKKKK